jgi:hypothetical protein
MDDAVIRRPYQCAPDRDVSSGVELDQQADALFLDAWKSKSWSEGVMVLYSHNGLGSPWQLAHRDIEAG